MIPFGDLDGTKVGSLLFTFCLSLGNYTAVKISGIGMKRTSETPRIDDYWWLKTMAETANLPQNPFENGGFSSDSEVMRDR